MFPERGGIALVMSFLFSSLLSLYLCCSESKQETKKELLLDFGSEGGGCVFIPSGQYPLSISLYYYVCSLKDSGEDERGAASQQVRGSSQQKRRAGTHIKAAAAETAAAAGEGPFSPAAPSSTPTKRRSD